MNSRNQFLLLTTLLSALLFIGCEKDIDPNSACDLTFRGEDWKMATDSQNFGCATYLAKYAYKGHYYYGYGSHCADMALNLALCDGEDLCTTNASLCNKILDKGEYLGIVAFLE